MDRLKKFWNENDDTIVQVLCYGLISTTALAVLCAMHANGRTVTSCDLLTDDDGRQIIATHNRNGTIDTWTKPSK